MSRLAFLLSLVCGCHQVFGLVRDDPDAGVGGERVEVDAAKGCWAAGETGDEDLDQIVDGCDPCPADVDAVITDSDGDGVGDECDPATDVVHTIIAFDGFRTDAMWRPISGDWKRSDGNQGELTQTIANTPFAYTELTIAPVRYPTIDVRFTPGAPPVNVSGAGAELVFPATRVACIYEYLNDTDAVAIYVNEQRIASAPFDAAGAIRIQLSSHPEGTVQCQAISGNASDVVLQKLVVPNATVTVGLVTKADTARFQSMTVIAAP